MSTDYDAVAEEYKRSRIASWRAYIERHSLLKLLGKVRGKSILDLACGEGFYSRLLRERGATRVVGVDLSSGMIGLAITAEKESPLGIEYRVSDAMAYQSDERFDIVTAAYLLNYADTEEKLAAMCRTVARSLKPGGRFVTVNNNPSQSPDRYQATRKYGFVKSMRGELQHRCHHHLYDFPRRRFIYFRQLLPQPRCARTSVGGRGPAGHRVAGAEAVPGMGRPDGLLGRLSRRSASHFSAV